MQNVETVPIEVFVTQIMATKPAMKIIEHWPLKSEVVMAIVVRHFHDLGVYRVSPFGQSGVMSDEVLAFLKNSPQILEMIDKAKRAAAAAAQRGRMKADQ